MEDKIIQPTRAEQDIDTEDYINKDSVVEIPPESKEFFSLETPSGHKIALGSCCVRCDLLRDMAIQTFEHLINLNGNKKQGASYLG